MLTASPFIKPKYLKRSMWIPENWTNKLQVHTQMRELVLPEKSTMMAHN